jgi:hypothetical protein
MPIRHLKSSAPEFQQQLDKLLGIDKPMDATVVETVQGILEDVRVGEEVVDVVVGGGEGRGRGEVVEAVEVHLGPVHDVEDAEEDYMLVRGE